MTPAEKRKIAESIRIAIDESGLTRAELARRSGVDQAILSRFVSGKGGLTLASIEKLAPILGLEIVLKKKGRRR